MDLVLILTTEDGLVVDQAVLTEDEWREATEDEWSALALIQSLVSGD